jgi:hypothetical protein
MPDVDESSAERADGADAPLDGNDGGARRLVRNVLLVCIILLYVASIPWYRDSDAPLVLIFGLPDWVAVALLCYGGVALLNSLAWLLTDISDPIEREATRAVGKDELEPEG